MCRGNNTTQAPNEADICINVESAQLQDRIAIADNFGGLRRGFATADTGTEGLLVQGGFRKLTVSVGNTATGFPHGLGYVPNKILISPRGQALVWQSAPATADSVVLQASPSPVIVDVYVA
jgi:hypothetical protein